MDVVPRKTRFATPFLLRILFRPVHRIHELLKLPAVRDSFSFLVLGFFMEGSRRAALLAWDKLQYELYIRSTHSVLEASHDWLIHYWTNHESWVRRARNFEFESKQRSTADKLYPWISMEDVRNGHAGKAKFKPSLMPKSGIAHYIRFQGHWVKFELVERPNSEVGYEERTVLVITIMTRSLDVLEALIVAAKEAYESQNNQSLTVKTLADGEGRGMWRKACMRYKRSLSSVIVEEGVADALLKDVSDFLGGQKWYLRRGIPWRRGYLLYGEPGTGKTSTIHAIASELGLDVYMVSLSSSGLNDTKLLAAMTAVPHGSIVVMEDIDASTTKRKPDPDSDSDSDSVTSGTGKGKEGKGKGKKADSKDEARSSITLSGLLNDIDGIAGSEGRLLFMTTNHKDKLDPALIRPGRADLQFRYSFATTKMIGDLFTLFYPSTLKSNSMDVEEILSPVKELSDFEAKMNKVVAKEDEMVWNKADVAAWRQRWSAIVPEKTFSIAQLQGLLMLHKTDPEAAIAATPAWVSETLAAVAQKRQEREEAHDK